MHNWYTLLIAGSFFTEITNSKIPLRKTKNCCFFAIDGPDIGVLFRYRDIPYVKNTSFHFDLMGSFSELIYSCIDIFFMDLAR